MEKNKTCKTCKKYVNYTCTLQDAEMINYCIFNHLFFHTDNKFEDDKAETK